MSGCGDEDPEIPIERRPFSVIKGKHLLSPSASQPLLNISTPPASRPLGPSVLQLPGPQVPQPLIPSASQPPRDQPINPFAPHFDQPLEPLSTLSPSAPQHLSASAPQHLTHSDSQSLDPSAPQVSRSSSLQLLSIPPSHRLTDSAPEHRDPSCLQPLHLSAPQLISSASPSAHPPLSPQLPRPGLVVETPNSNEYSKLQSKHQAQIPHLTLSVPQRLSSLCSQPFSSSAFREICWNQRSNESGCSSTVGLKGWRAEEVKAEGLKNLGLRC